MTTEPEVSASFDELLAALDLKHQKFVLALLEEPNRAKAARAAGYSARSARQQGHRLLTNADIRAALEAGWEQQVLGKKELLARLTDRADFSAEHFLTFKRVRYLDGVLVEPAEALDLVRDKIADVQDQLDGARSEKRRVELSGEIRRLRRIEKKAEKALQLEDDLDGDDEDDGPPRGRRGRGRMPMRRAPSHIMVELEWRTRLDIRVDLEKARAAGKLHMIKKIKETKFGLEVEWHDRSAAEELLGRYHKLFAERVSVENPDGSPIKFIVGVGEDDL